MKPILIVAPYFAPQSHAAVFRAHKLAKYLPAHGWKPYVVTVDTNYLYNEDPGLLAELPDEIEIVRARYIEPTIRGVRMAFGGRDRSFKAMKPQLAEGTAGASDGAISTQWGMFVARAYSTVKLRWLDSPDGLWPWERPAMRAARELIDLEGIELVLTTAMPYTSHRIGRALQQETGVQWIADFRDPAGYGEKFSRPIGLLHDRQQVIVRDTLRYADVITSTSSSYALIFRDLFGDITRRPIEFIPTGIDDALIPGPGQAPEGPYIVYVGEIMPDQDEDFFEILARAFAEARAYRLIVVGHELLNRRRLAALLERYSLSKRVEFVDHVSQAEVYRLIVGARAGILAPGRTAYWWNNHAKLVDYIGLRKPVLAVVPDPSEARSALVRANLGVFLDGDTKEASATLAKFLSGNLPAPQPIADACNRYLASSQVTTFVEVFESLG